MCTQTLHAVANVKLPDIDGRRELACPYCQRPRTAQEWLALGFECNCSSFEDSANVLQTSSYNEHGEVVMCRVPEFWDLYFLASSLFERQHNERSLTMPPKRTHAVAFVECMVTIVMGWVRVMFLKGQVAF
jgi:hypothetical protein